MPLRFKNTKTLLLALAGAFCFSAAAQNDSITTLPEVSISARAIPKNSSVPASAQAVNEFSLERISAAGISDVLKTLSGVNIKDYGGIGGIKTISVRSLGSNHTAVSYDGLIAGDVQTGQMDLGTYSLSELSYLSLDISGTDDLLLNARSRASASLLRLESAKPLSGDDKNFAAKVKFSAGSFDTYNPFVKLEGRYKNISAYASANYLKSRGDYPFLLVNGDLASWEKRLNSDVESFNMEAGIFTGFTKTDELNIKARYYNSRRGLPGSVVLYNSHSGERLGDEKIFAQFRYKNIINNIFSMAFYGSFNSSGSVYENPDYLGGPIKDEYTQKESYLSTVLAAKPIKGLDISLANDVLYNTLDSNLPRFVYPERTAWISSLSACYTWKFISLRAAIVSLMAWENTKYGGDPENKNALSPNVSLSLEPIKGLKFEAYYKHSYRLPTFNDLYYSRTGNINIRPERAGQLGLAANYSALWLGGEHYFSAALDVYHNSVKNKIIAIPTHNLFLWSMMNFGRARIIGGELRLSGRRKFAENWYLSGQLNYTLSEASDDEPSSKRYTELLPYSPLSTAYASLSLQWKKTSLNLSANYSGWRYGLPENTDKNRLPDYFLANASFSTHLITNKLIDVSLKGEFLNIGGAQYDVVKNYPMPPFNWQLGIICEL